MKLVFVAFNFGEYSVRLTSALAESMDVHLFLPEAQAKPHLRYLSPTVHYEPFHPPRMRELVKQIRLQAHLVSRIRAIDPDIIHVQQGYAPWNVMALPRLRRYPVVLTVHDPTAHPGDRPSRATPQRLWELGFRQATALIAHTEFVREALVARGADPARCHVVPHCQLGDPQQAEGVEEEPNLVLFFGRIWDYKGIEYLIQAEPLIAAEIPNVKILIAGRGDSFDRYRRMIQHPERFEIDHRFIPPHEVGSYFRRAAVVVLPYIQATQSGVIVTAYTFRKPVVATRVGGLPAMVRDGETGFLVPPGDAHALAGAVIRLLRDPALRHRLGATGEQEARTTYAASSIARATRRVYDQVLRAWNGRPSTGPPAPPAMSA